MRSASAVSACAFTSSWSTTEARRRVQQVLERQQPARAQLAPCPLVREALELRRERQPRVVQQDELAVGAETEVRLEALDARRQCPRQRDRGVVRPVGPPETVRVERQHAVHDSAAGHRRCEQPANVVWRSREALVWTLTFTLIGYAFSDSFTDAGDTATRVTLIAVLLATAAFAIRARRTRR